MTFSLAARCKRSGMLGTVVASSSICVASRCAFSRANVGAVMTQNITNPALGPRGLDLMEQGLPAGEVLDRLRTQEPDIEWRQLGLIDAAGQTAVFSGKKTLGIHARARGDHCVAQGNLLANENVPPAMVSAFERIDGHLADRLLASLRAGLDAGGELGPVFSAALEVVDTASWPIIDLRVDWHIAPIHELAILWEVYRPQVDAYIQRALDPARSESYGVPGDE